MLLFCLPSVAQVTGTGKARIGGWGNVHVLPYFTAAAGSNTLITVEKDTATGVNIYFLDSTGFILSMDRLQSATTGYVFKASDYVLGSTGWILIYSYRLSTGAYQNMLPISGLGDSPSRVTATAQYRTKAISHCEQAG